MSNKQYISAQQLLDDSFALGLQVLEDAYVPDFIIGVWRGGTPVGIAVQELLAYFDITSDHIAVRTSLYKGIEQRGSLVEVYGLDYVINRVNAASRILLVDDVHDSGLSLQQIVQDLTIACQDRMPMVRLATPYYKPANNKVGKVPDYFVHETDDWLVFPHELVGLTAQEILGNKPGVDVLKEKLMAKVD
ncbi:phosphoribosyltransferase [Oceanicoccus sp. KOV_DT_Chl]|uniref:phosphoribosyltransferase n=1 Tax=Oceanicoccus sp. KOV_DT_Chl TaxID=1904639 RepID=UPI000C7B889C|nr:phosphoribosyltransferase family protein [Oceanicoccus sp. KOV_DT_Chl]